MDIPKYPETPKEEIVETIHGTEVRDPYRWLEDVESERASAWIASQNAVTFDFLSRIPGRDKIRQRMTELWNYERQGLPIKRGGRYFFTRNDGLQDQRVLCWMDSPEGEPRVIVDPNELSSDGTVSLEEFAVSEDGGLVAYGLSTSGSAWQEWRVREVDTGHDLDDRVRWIKVGGVWWTHDGQGFFYSRFDEPQKGVEYNDVNKNQKLCYHRIGNPQSDDEVVYERPDHDGWVLGSVRDDGQYLVVGVGESDSHRSEVFYKDLSVDGGELIELLKGFEAAYYFVGNDGGVFYFCTDQDAPMWRVLTIDTARPDPSHWKEVIPESTDAMHDVWLVGDNLIAIYLHDAHSVVRVHDKGGRFVREVDLPGIGTVEEVTVRQNEREAFYWFSGYTTPAITYRYDVETGDSTVFHESRINFEPDDYVTEQVFYSSKDGTRVPMFLSHRKGLKLDGNNPTCMYGYGAGGVSMTPSFSVITLVWMEMGGVYAEPNIRGGGEYGRGWAEAGMKLKKQNAFDDFIAAAEWLVEHRYTRTARLAILGGSSGGTLLGVCMTQRPDLFGACLLAVGVVDMLRFHTLTPGSPAISEYGSPENPEEFEALLAYSPYHNVRPGIDYPATLVLTGDHDEWVSPAHSYKFTAALQGAQAGPAPVLLRVDLGTGHGEGKPTYKSIDERSDMWAFLVRALGMNVS